MEEALEKEEVKNEEDNKEQENENINEEPKKEKKSKKILDFFITTLDGMAYGLFATLIIGTILGTIGTLLSSIGGNVFNYVGKAKFIAYVFTTGIPL